MQMILQYNVYDIQYDKQVLENNLQRSIVLLQQWCKENGMLINTEKTKVMFITSRQKRCNLNDASFHLKCNNIDLKLTKGDKILGANIDENLIWDSHYKYIVKKVSTHLWLLSEISSYYQLMTGFCFIMRIFALILITVPLFGDHLHVLIQIK